MSRILLALLIVTAQPIVSKGMRAELCLRDDGTLCSLQTTTSQYGCCCHHGGKATGHHHHCHGGHVRCRSHSHGHHDHQHGDEDDVPCQAAPLDASCGGFISLLATDSDLAHTGHTKILISIAQSPGQCSGDHPELAAIKWLPGLLAEWTPVAIFLAQNSTSHSPLGQNEPSDFHLASIAVSVLRC